MGASPVFGPRFLHNMQHTRQLTPTRGVLVWHAGRVLAGGVVDAWFNCQQDQGVL